MSVGKRIRRLRKTLDMTQSELAGYLRVRTATVSDWETSKNDPDRGTLRLLSDLCGDSRSVFLWLQEGAKEPLLEPASDRNGTEQRPQVPDLPRFPESLGSDPARRSRAIGYVQELAGIAGEYDYVPSYFLLEAGRAVVRMVDALERERPR